MEDAQAEALQAQKLAELEQRKIKDARAKTEAL
jgi:hypothetical protein